MNSDDNIYNFLDSLAISRKSRYDYVCILRAYQRFIVERKAGKTLSLDTVRAWLKQDAARPLAIVVGRMGIIERYLEWRAAAKKGRNPLADLHCSYGRLLHPIVEALLKDDYRLALEKLRPLPEWGSPLGPMMHAHVARMQSLGYRYSVKERDLRRFDRYLQSRPDLEGEPLSMLLGAWRSSCRGVRHQLRVQQCGRALSQAMHRKDATIPVLSVEKGLRRRVILEERKPYIFTESEIIRLFKAASTYPSRLAPLRPMMLRTVLTLAYCTGMRIGEIVALRVGDVDMQRGLLEIHETKFFKSRQLPLHASVCEALSKYLTARIAVGAPVNSEASMWWCPLRRHGYSYSQLEKLVTRVIRHAGLKPASGQRGPRVHDLRHTFVAHRMQHWYREGVEPQARLPHLATYLGHKDIASTLVYLNITPEVLRHASEQHRRRGAAVLRASGGQS